MKQGGRLSAPSTLFRKQCSRLTSASSRDTVQLWTLHSFLVMQRFRLPVVTIYHPVPSIRDLQSTSPKRRFAL
ncbi:uncharacterized protein PHALS_13521 [Plasmopara halstedii]|uniref:Uncharacterized protein n=1 Tax=Plasmopara halstedii TaxID=4781 RepID=A0A0P1AQC1_PLAHL|nr:uncharacterized protein PHALS_13521 [Plasmopara halstedii]CEG43318.1 hypothetical protein PHALS_13521 [Plasmopara halstedii]|eukprot:XP_024579687.1 hypothetical protein PHALS_13521 [Plasmopara halstedii]